MNWHYKVETHALFPIQSIELSGCSYHSKYQIHQIYVSFDNISENSCQNAIWTRKCMSTNFMLNNDRQNESDYQKFPLRSNND